MSSQPELEHKAVRVQREGGQSTPGKETEAIMRGTVPLLQRLTKALLTCSVKLARAFCSGLIYGDGSDQAHEPAVVVAQRVLPDWPRATMPMRSQRTGLFSECGSV